jgi:ribosomal protein S18 acetylase RimI-like enzyme
VTAHRLAIRRMDERDALEVVVRLWRRAREDAQPWLEARLGHTHEDDLRFFRDVVMSENHVWLVVDGDTVCGLLAIAGARVSQLHVDPAHQGAGVGSALLAHAKALAPRGLELHTHRRNARARRFYERRGFRAVALGTSPPPESEPDVAYAWAPAPPR